MSNLHVPPEIWLAELFETEYCEECGGDAEHHTAVPFMGNWFARCDYPAKGKMHPVIEAFHRTTGYTHLVDYFNESLKQ